MSRGQQAENFNLTEIPTEPVGSIPRPPRIVGGNRKAFTGKNMRMYNFIPYKLRWLQRQAQGKSVVFRRVVAGRNHGSPKVLPE